LKELIKTTASEFSGSSHGNSNYCNDEVFVKGASDDEFVPLSYLLKKTQDIKDIADLQENGFVYSSLTYLDISSFDSWFQKMFNKKLQAKKRKQIGIIHYPDTKKIFEAVEIVDQVYSILKNYKVLVNGKNLPIQLGEWYAKSIFGLKQIKSTSQRGFDFYSNDKKVEVKIHWHDITSPKGVKLKKSLVEMSDLTIIMYVAKNFMIRDILLLDSDFVLRKFAGKGHTIFLKDGDVSGYFFSKSSKHYEKIINKKALLQFSTPNLAMKIDEQG
jgi:hypothetical protein